MREDEHAHFHERVEIHLHVDGPITVNMIGPPATPPSDVTEEMAAELVKDAKQMRQSLLMAQAAVVALVHSQTDLTKAYAAYVADEPKRQAAAVADALAADGADEDTIAQAIQDTTATAAASVQEALDAIHANTSQPTPPPVDSLPTTGDDSTGGGQGGTDTLTGGAGDDTLTSGGGADTLNAGGSSATDTLLGGQGDDSVNGGNGSDAVNTTPPILATPVVADDSTPTASELAGNDASAVIAGNADGSSPVAVVTTDPSITAQVGSPASAIVTDHPTDGTTLITPVLSPDLPAAGSVTVDAETGAPVVAADA